MSLDNIVEFINDFYPFVFPSLSGNLCKMAPGCKKWLFLLQLEKWASPEYPTSNNITYLHGENVCDKSVLQHTLVS